MRVVRARYEGGVLRPLEPLDLKEGEEVTIRVEPGPRKFFGIVGQADGRNIEEEYHEHLSERANPARG